MLIKKAQIVKWFCFLAILFLVMSCGVSKSLNDVPDVSKYNPSIPERVKLSDSAYVSGNNFLTKNKQGLWELYVEGNPFEIGMQTGSLTQELFKKQELAFLSKVDVLVPSKTKQFFLRKILAWYNCLREQWLIMNLVRQFQLEHLKPDVAYLKRISA